LTGLSSGTEYHYQIAVTDSSGNSAASGDLTFTTTSGGPISAFVSDDFNGVSLDGSMWSFVNPLGDGSATVSGGQLSLYAPSGVTHDVWGSGSIPFSNTLIRVMQGTTDTDFDLEVKFDSGVSNGQQQGIYIEEDSDDLLRLEFLGNGSSTRLFTASFKGGIATVRTYTSIGSGGAGPVYMRVSRTGSQWTISYSFDGSSWTTGSSFSHGMSVSSVGIHVGNSASVSHTALVDYFYDHNSVPADTTPPVISNIQVVPDLDGALINWSTNEGATSAVSYGLTSGYDSLPWNIFVAASGQVRTGNDHVLVRVLHNCGIQPFDDIIAPGQVDFCRDDDVTCCPRYTLTQRISPATIIGVTYQLQDRIL